MYPIPPQKAQTSRTPCVAKLSVFVSEHGGQISTVMIFYNLSPHMVTCQHQPILQPSLSYLHTSYCLSHVKSNQSYNHLFLTFTLPTVYHMSRPTNLTTISFLPSHFLLFITCQVQPILQPSLSYLHTSYCLSHVKSNQSYNHLFLTFTLPTVYHMSSPTNLTTISFLPSHFLLFITCQVQPILQPSLSYLHTSYCLSHV